MKKKYFLKVLFLLPALTLSFCAYTNIKVDIPKTYPPVIKKARVLFYERYTSSIDSYYLKYKKVNNSWFWRPKDEGYFLIGFISIYTENGNLKSTQIIAKKAAEMGGELVMIKDEYGKNIRTTQASSHTVRYMNNSREQGSYTVHIPSYTIRKDTYYSLGSVYRKVKR